MSVFYNKLTVIALYTFPFQSFTCQNCIALVLDTGRQEVYYQILELIGKNPFSAEAKLLGCIECVSSGLLQLMILFCCVSVSLSVTHLHSAKPAEWIDILLGMRTLGDPRNIVLDGGPRPS